MVTSTEAVEKSGMFLRMIFVVGLCSLALVSMALAESPPNASANRASSGNGPEDASLTSLIAKLRKENSLVGLGAMIMVDGKVVASAVQGERKIGSGTPLELGDRWHLGSITKSITATMIARLVESGQMKWSDSIGEYYPDASIHEDWKPITLKQLLTHMAGAPANFSSHVGRKQPALGDECTRARREAVLEVLAKKPVHPPGTKFAYSNVGYTIAGAMAEKATSESWEDLVKREVFEPLELTGAGFGPPKSPDKTLEQPRGHQAKWFGWTKVAVDDEADNTPIIGPAGTVHMTLRDLCTYATEHLCGDLGTGRLLSAETYQLLHESELGPYACGWVWKEPTAEIPHTAYWHNGSNTLWYALVAFIPEKNMVIAVTSNDGDFVKAEAAAWKVVESNFTPDPSLPQQQSDFPRPDYPKKAPFNAVRWRESEPEVKVDGEWLKLVSLDELPTSEIVAFSRRLYGNEWRKRFEEDLVELLTRMGHPPQDTVKLVVQSPASSEKQVLEDVPMTKENRRAIKAAAIDRANSKP